MNKAQLVEAVSNQTRLTKGDVEEVLNNILTTIKQKVKSKDDVTLVGFGTFTTSHRKSRRGRNPQTGETMEVPATVLPKFRPGKEFRNLVLP